MSEGKAKTKGLIDKVLDPDTRIIFLLLLIVLVAPLIKPIGFPIAVSPYSKDLYNAIEDLKPGSIVLFWNGMGWGWWPSEYRPAVVAIVQRLVDKGVKIISVSGTMDDPLIWDSFINSLIDLKNYKYGEDYLILGFLPGGEAAKATFASDIRAIVSVDYIQNKPVDQFPIMKGVNDAKAFDLVIEISSTPAEILIRQFYTTHGVKIGLIGSAGMFSDFLPYYASGQIVGFTCGLRGGAEFEFLTQKPRWGIAALDALSTSHILMVILLCLSNVLFLVKKRGGEMK